MRGYLFLLLGLLLISCSQKKTQRAMQDSQDNYYQYEGVQKMNGGAKMVEISTPSGKFNVWTKQIGNNPDMKVLILHGGPGGNHFWYQSFNSYLPAAHIEYYYYDQLGSWFSDQPRDTSLWNTARFVDEVEQLRKALRLSKDNFYLYGHSWGGILAIEYALKYQQHLKGLIISNMMSSVPAYNTYADSVLAR